MVLKFSPVDLDPGRFAPPGTIGSVWTISVVTACGKEGGVCATGS